MTMFGFFQITTISEIGLCEHFPLKLQLMLKNLKFHPFAMPLFLNLKFFCEGNDESNITTRIIYEHLYQACGS